ncbi:MAG TPA: hypothetical protein VK689_10065 [Armatimonadota bacterium]|jgi:hypothetical protein|nr:hypothetical protein [Armatimonadota bacterium]
MGYKKRVTLASSPSADNLRQRLVVEWRKEEDNGQEPIIIEEPSGPYQMTRLYVIWQDWAELSQQERSEIIMDAFEELRSQEDVLKVSVAMGLTHEEAKRMGIDYE